MNVSLEIIEDAAYFCYPPEYHTCVEEFDRLLDERESGRVGEKRYIDRLKDLAKRYPWFIDAHAHIGNVLLYNGRTKHALDAYRKGFSLGEAAIPTGYSGLIEWQPLENRPFFRAAHGIVLCHLRLRHWNEAIDLMKAMDLWNPRDNQGIRYLLGSAFLRAGRKEEARMHLKEFRGEEPSLRYELGLLQLIEGEYRAAATSLRHGFIENGYIAEIICGTPDPLPIAMWHGTSWAGPEFAIDYIDLFGGLWDKTPGAVEFVRWLNTHPEVMAERAAFLACAEELLWERDSERRRSIGDKQAILACAIDGKLSDRIVVKRTNQVGIEAWPWLHAASCRLSN
ncbi:MAG: hypothetical protein OXF88_07880 [Rhodobacteraceae bacterium]|nr:hypothetical protein [Paracoccaceae bacterium]MCY4136698.1 hypothetical protein [Paracoccaceae bacterium]